ncbi:hypothetical protein [Leptospira sp. GIMC2001]|uniref:hypothetical protein n=1 Tax=Leptospira sp. GIMC2001 TaxID=1513297 RepID=UPI00234AE7BD|nr:hypothetical protein [Leptospira sp. GIMC2001]WCL48599.1 hypothetical protein O4O04_14990 [Leptospira sp. GIMC2001]
MEKVSGQIDRILNSSFKWNLVWYGSTDAKPNGHCLSPDSRWLIIYFQFIQFPEDRYESEILDQECILFDLNNHRNSEEVGRFRYYYNFNSCADYSSSQGAKFEFLTYPDGTSSLQIGEETLHLNDLDHSTIQEILSKFNW